MLSRSIVLYRLVGTDTAGASNLYYHQLPFLIRDLSQQSTNYTATQPCMDTFLYQIEHINETVIALPPAAEVCCFVFPCTPVQAA